MSLDYDLVVIGNTPEAVYAALEAVKLKARVAWVVGENETDPYTEIDRYTLSHFTYLERQWKTITQWALDPNLSQSNFNLTHLKTWTQQVKTNLKEQYSPAILAAMGVDVIFESGEFCRLPQQAFVLPSRKLRSRSYLIATGSISWTPPIIGLSEVSYLTPETLCLDNLPDELIILGETPIGIELAQHLNRLGKKITLVVEQQHILPQEDCSAIQLIQGQLEAEGIRLLTQSPITQVKQINDKKWVQAGNQAIEADEIILTMGNQPNIKGLNLEGVRVEMTPQKIKVNPRLQTTNPKIYACGSVIDGYKPSNIAQYEASIAIKNALFFPWFKVNYSNLAYRILTNPPLTRVGLTETEAKRQYGNKKIIVIEEYFKTLAKAQITGEITGICKLITRRNGEILGCHCVGFQGDELIGAITLAMNHKIPIQDLACLFPPSPTISEILSRISHTWKDQKFQNNKFLSTRLEQLLFWRRKWS